MARLKNIENRVRYILTENPASRDDDNVLFVEYLKQEGYDTSRSIESFFKDKSRPNLSSISRVRRKLQALNLDLRPTKEVTEIRENEQLEYMDYALGM